MHNILHGCLGMLLVKPKNCIKNVIHHLQSSKSDIYLYEMIIAISLLLINNLSALDIDKSPGENFDLSHWKLNLPDTSEKSTSDLENGFENEYFKTSDDGSMLFYVRGGDSGTELHHLCNPTASNPDLYNWPVESGTYTVSGRYKIGSSNVPSTKIIIQQIHALNGPPLVVIKWEQDKIYAFVTIDSRGVKDDEIILGDVSQNQEFLVNTTIKDGYLQLYFNDELIYNHTVTANNYWAAHKNYFKTGNYLESNSSQAEAYVYVYYLYVYQAGECSYTVIASNDKDNTIFIIIAIVCVCLVCILCGFGFFF
eukprot:72571_1